MNQRPNGLVSGRGAGRKVQLASAVACVVALAAAACLNSTTSVVTTTTPPVAAAYGQECKSFPPDPEHAFFAINDTYTDPDPIDWETATLAEVGLDEEVLEAAAANAALSGDIASLLVVRDGKLVFKRYFNGRGQRDRRSR